MPLTDQFALSGSEEEECLNLTASEIEVKAVGSIVLPLQTKHMFDPLLVQHPHGHVQASVGLSREQRPYFTALNVLVRTYALSERKNTKTKTKTTSYLWV